MASDSAEKNERKSHVCLRTYATIRALNLKRNVTFYNFPRLVLEPQLSKLALVYLKSGHSLPK